MLKDVTTIKMNVNLTHAETMQYARILLITLNACVEQDTEEGYVMSTLMIATLTDAEMEEDA